MAEQTVYLTTTGANVPWTVPAWWNSADNEIEMIGGGSGGGAAGGGTGGAYSKLTNFPATPGATLTYRIGAGGAAGAAGEDTWISNTGSAPTDTSEGGLAKGGGAPSGNTGGTGGTTASGIGDTKYAGGKIGRAHV